MSTRPLTPFCGCNQTIPKAPVAGADEQPAPLLGPGAATASPPEGYGGEEGDQQASAPPSEPHRRVVGEAARAGAGRGLVQARACVQMG